MDSRPAPATHGPAEKRQGEVRMQRRKMEGKDKRERKSCHVPDWVGLGTRPRITWQTRIFVNKCSKTIFSNQNRSEFEYLTANLTYGGICRMTCGKSAAILLLGKGRPGPCYSRFKLKRLGFRKWKAGTNVTLFFNQNKVKLQNYMVQSLGQMKGFAYVACSDKHPLYLRFFSMRANFATLTHLHISFVCWRRTTVHKHSCSPAGLQVYSGWSSSSFICIAADSKVGRFVKLRSILISQSPAEASRWMSSVATMPTTQSVRLRFFVWVSLLFTVWGRHISPDFHFFVRNMQNQVAPMPMSIEKTDPLQSVENGAKIDNAKELQELRDNFKYEPDDDDPYSSDSDVGFGLHERTITWADEIEGEFLCEVLSFNGSRPLTPASGKTSTLLKGQLSQTKQDSTCCTIM